MIRWQLEIMWPVVAGLLAFAAFTLHVYAHTDRLYRLKLALIPALLAVAALSFTWFGAKLGYGYPAALPERFEYVAHRLILQNDRKAWLDVLVVSRKPLERDARLHRVPWSKPLEDSLKEAQRMQGKGGGWIEMDGQRNGDAYPQWVPRRVLPQDVAPKDPLPRERERDLLAPQGPRL
jgi:hypothetical protein